MRTRSELAGECQVARDDHRDQALGFARSFNRVIEVVFDVVDCVAYPAVRIVSERRLPASAGQPQA